MTCHLNQGYELSKQFRVTRNSGCMFYHLYKLRSPESYTVVLYLRSREYHGRMDTIHEFTGTLGLCSYFCQWLDEERRDLHTWDMEWQHLFYDKDRLCPARVQQSGMTMYE